jgi:hypothetical protein
MSDISTNCSSDASPTDGQPTADNTPKRDYEVGYGKPPKKTQFKKGQSGNPSGSKRTERVDDIAVVFDEILAEPVTILNGGKPQTMTKLELIFYAQRLNALKGNPKAFRAIAKLAQKTGQFSRAKPRSNLVFEDPANEDQKKILRMFEVERQSLKRS